MRFRLFRSLSGVVILGGLLVASFAPVLAANQESGITLSPAFQEITVLPSQGDSSQSFTLTNNDDLATTFTLATVDMGALDDSGGIIFSGLSADYATKYGLAKWLRLDRQTITLTGHSSATVTFTVINTVELGPGGHYGAIIVKPELTALPKKNEVTLAPQAATLVFLRKVGGEHFGLSLAPVNPRTAYWRLPTDLQLPFMNTGNVHVVPRGVVTLTRDWKQREVARGIINAQSSLILPEKPRDYQVQLSTQGRLFLPGRYYLSIAYRYDGKEDFTVWQVSFWYWNLPLLLVILITLVVLTALTYRFRNSRIGRVVRRLTRVISHFCGKVCTHLKPKHKPQR